MGLRTKKNIMATKDDKMETLKEIPNCLPSKGTESLYLNSTLADIHFTFKSNDKRIPAHKLILAISPVFKTAFYGSMPEKDEVKIEDEGVDAEAFKEFLQFFYLKNVKLSMENIKSVMHFGKKYQVDECLSVCSTFLKETLTIDEMSLGFQLALYYDQNDLKEFCQREISINTKRVLESEGFLNCDWNVLKEIIKFDEISCCEYDLLSACMDWARNVCERKKLNTNDKGNIRNQLKDVIYEIRFNQVSASEFSDYLILNPNNPYNSKELTAIFPVVISKIITPTEFNLEPRLISIDSTPIVWNESNNLQCCPYIKGIERYNIPKIVTTIFSCNKSVIFGKFEIYDISNGRNVCFDILIGESDSERIIIDTFHGSSRTIFLPKPIIIKKNTKYKIQLDFSTNKTELSCSNGHKQVVKLDNDVTFTFHRDESTDFDNVEKNVINWLRFNALED